MCGIVGFVGDKEALPILIEGLKTLEYRGYDSAGVSLWEKSQLTVKTKGRIFDLEEKLKGVEGNDARCGIGHTRWATHGVPSDKNAHPHFTDSITLVHNGIIENYAEIKRDLIELGYVFESETDTEVAVKLLDLCYKIEKNPIKAIKNAIKKIRGSYAFGIMFKDYPMQIFSVRKDSPLIVSKTSDGAMIASDIPAILSYSKEYYRLEEGVIARLYNDKIEFYKDSETKAEQKKEYVHWNAEQAQKGGFPHFMLKEICEEPEAIKKTIHPRLKDGLPYFDNEMLDTNEIVKFSAIHIVACGTAMHAGLIGKAMIEKIARIPVNVEIASEFRYRDPILNKNDLVILLSQSGETADTLAALRHAKKEGIKTLAIVNVMDSSVAREADSVLYTWAGPEIAVASTKAYTVQCALLILIALRMGLASGKLDTNTAKEYCDELINGIPKAVEEAISLKDNIKEIAKHYAGTEHFFFIGRGIDWPLSTEASLKLKEISYIHSEAYAAGELKHGTISLITDGIPVVAILTVSNLAEKTISGVREVKSRGADVLTVLTKDIDEKYQVPSDQKILIPKSSELLSPLVAATILQLFAYFMSVQLGLDVDKPRNLAKSVTVE